MSIGLRGQLNEVQTGQIWAMFSFKNDNYCGQRNQVWLSS